MLLCDGDAGTHQALENVKSEADTSKRAQSRHTCARTHTNTHHPRTQIKPLICIHGQSAGDLTGRDGWLPSPPPVHTEFCQKPCNLTPFFYSNLSIKWKAFIKMLKLMIQLCH